MGMYDSVKIGVRLSGKLYDDSMFQTKSFDNQLDEYKIDKRGQLLKMRVKYLKIPLKKRVWYKKSLKASDPGTRAFYRMVGSVKKKRLGWTPYPWTGDAWVYSLGKTGKWRDFTLTFHDGKLIRHRKRSTV